MFSQVPTEVNFKNKFLKPYHVLMNLSSTYYPSKSNLITSLV